MHRDERTKMKIFDRTGEHWLFGCGIIYLCLGFADIFVLTLQWTPWIQMGWLTSMVLPFLFPPLGRWLNMDITWDKNMFSMLKKKPSNVVPFPKEPEHGGGDGGGSVPPEPKKPSVTYYTLGMTSENRLEFKMGYSAITMNHGGVTNLIQQLQTFQKQLAQYEGIEESTEE